MKINLGLHLGFASTRYNNPKIWTDIVRNEFNLDYVQFVSDLIEPNLPKYIIDEEIKKVNFYTKKHKIKIKDTMTLPRYNYIGHHNPKISDYWKDWLKRFVKISAQLGAQGAGSLLGIYSFDDLNNNLCVEIEGQISPRKSDKDLNLSRFPEIFEIFGIFFRFMRFFRFI